MIIDADCHISSRKFNALAITAAELVAQMDRAGVDKALVWLKPPYNKKIEPENRAVHEAVRAHPDRLIGFGWVNPRLGGEPPGTRSGSASRSTASTGSSSTARRTST